MLLPSKPLYRLHEAAIRALYEEVKARANATGELLPGTPGTLVKRAGTGHEYWYRSYSPAPRKRSEQFVGTAGNSAAYEAMQSRIADAEWTARQVAALSKLRGNHSLDFGMEYRAYRQNKYNGNTTRSGSYVFSTTWTRGPLDNSTTAPLGQGFAAFLLGLPETSSLIARNAAFASLAWAPPAGWRASVELQALSHVEVNDTNTDAAGSYAIANVGAGYILPFEQWQFTGFARIDNFTNRRYVGSVIVNEANSRFFEPAPTRTWLFGVDLPF